MEETEKEKKFKIKTRKKTDDNLKGEHKNWEQTEANGSNGGGSSEPFCAVNQAHLDSREPKHSKPKLLFWSYYRGNQDSSVIFRDAAVLQTQAKNYKDEVEESSANAIMEMQSKAATAETEMKGLVANQTNEAKGTLAKLEGIIQR